MATISQLPFSPFHYRRPLFYSHQNQSQIFASYLNLTKKKKKHSFVCFACSIKQARVRKRVKSNEELRSEIMEFVALNGFPQGHVPSMKELSAHGRVDLANVVRRRGYKFIKELLVNSDVVEDCKELVFEEDTKVKASLSGICLEDLITGQGEQALDEVDRNWSTERPSSNDGTGSVPTAEGVLSNLGSEAEEYASLSNDESSLAGVSSMEKFISNLGESKQSDEITEDTLKIESIELSNRADIESSSSEASVFANDSLVLDDTSSCSDREVDYASMVEDEAEEYASVSNDELSLAGVSSMENSLSNLGDNNHSGENSLKIESVEFNNGADIEDSSSETSVSANHSLVIDDGSSCSDRVADNVLVAEDEEVNDVEEELTLTYDHYTTQDFNSNVDNPTESYPAENFTNQQTDDMAENRSCSADDILVGLSSPISSIEEKTTRFIQNGYLDTVDDDENRIPDDSHPEETKESAETSKGGEYIGDSYGGLTSVSSPPNGSALALEEVIHATEVNSSDRSDERDGRADPNNDPHDEIMERENQVEITRLRFMLRQKELELSKLKEQIEKEKLSLSVLQRQAETEIQKAQMLVSEKDVELQEAEESLSGLQEVEIEYCGDGNVVEVTGSFNGWEHRVGLELQASKSIGKQKCWSTFLWLYPGTYEIKFIVDGQWTTDPQRDSVTKGHITNNIIKVSR